MTQFILSVETFADAVRKNGTQMFMMPAIQKGFEGLLTPEYSDAPPSAVNWQRVINNWSLPFPKKPRKK
jgi:hypothetical protein